MQKQNLTLQVNGKTASAYLAAPNDGGPGVLVLHAWWGLKPFFKQVCDQLAEHGFTALAPDLYEGEVAQTIDAAKALMQSRDQERMGSIVKAAHNHLAQLTKASLSILGFSMGASWALLTATNELDVVAVVMFYGAGEADYSNLTAKVLGHFVEGDEWEPMEWVDKMEAEMKSAGVDVTLHKYQNVSHWFMETDRPEYNAGFATLAWQRTFEFLKKNL